MCVLGGVRERLGHHEVGRCLHGGREPLRGHLPKLHRYRRAACQALQRRAQTAVREDAGVDARGKLAQVADAGLGLLERLLHELTRLAGGLRPFPLCELQADHRSDELLLGAVVQVAAEPAALVVAGLHDPGARGGELFPCVHVGEGRGDQLREVGKPVLNPFGKRAWASARGHDAPPRRPGDRQRRADGRLDPDRPQPLHELAPDVRVVIDPLRPAAAPHLPRDRRPIDGDVLARREPGRPVGGPGANDGLGPVALEAQDVGALHAEDPADLFADAVEQAARLRITGHEHCDSTQRRLLGEERFELCHRGLVVGHCEPRKVSTASTRR